MRTDLLNPQEKNALKEALRNNILFKGFEKSIRQLTMTEDGCYTISCEDIFCVVAEEIDNILEDPKNAAFNVRDLWGRLEDGYQDLVDRNLTQEKINNLVGTTISCIQVFFQYADNYQFHDLYLPLAAGLEDHRVGWRKMYAVILDNIRRLGSDDFKKAVAEYLTSEEYLSDVIVEAIRIDEPHEIGKKKTEHIRYVDINSIVTHLNHKFKKNYIPELKTILETQQSDKSLARAAYVIFSSPCFIKNDYNGIFKNWYIDFCKFVGCTYHKNYAPSSLKGTSKEFEGKFYFLYQK
jgi:hypothetical protein